MFHPLQAERSPLPIWTASALLGVGGEQGQAHGWKAGPGGDVDMVERAERYPSHRRKKTRAVLCSP